MQFILIRRLLAAVFDIGKVVILSAAIIVPIRMFIFQPFFVRGTSMDPTFHNGDYLIIDEITYRFRSPQRGEVVVFRYPQDPKQFYIKRIIGLPGEKVIVRDGEVSLFTDSKLVVLAEPYLKGAPTPGDEELIAAPGQYIVFGDNRGASKDSRSWGALEKEYIIGRVLLTAWPPTAISVFAAPVYENF